MSRDIPYFKIKYSIKPTWSLEEAAYLLTGTNPDATTLKIGPQENNKVSRLYIWLNRLHAENRLHRVGFGNSKQLEEAEKQLGGRRLTRKETLHLIRDKKDISTHKRYDPTQVITLMIENDKSFDGDFSNIFKLLNGCPATGKTQNQINKAVYRYAAKLLWGRHPTLTATQLADVLQGLPERLKEEIPVSSLQAGSIREYLKGLSPHGKGAPKKSEEAVVDIDWSYLIERM